MNYTSLSAMIEAFRASGDQALFLRRLGDRFPRHTANRLARILIHASR
jgi:hypothetical protein